MADDGAVGMDMRALETERRLTSIEEKLDGITWRIDNVVVSQMKAQGKRIETLDQRVALLERGRAFLLGWGIGAGIIGGGAASALMRYLG